MHCFLNISTASLLVSLATSPVSLRDTVSSAAAAAAAKSLQSCLTLCDPIDGSPPGSPVPGILQAKTLEWVAISFSTAWKWKMKVKSLSHIRLFVTLWTAAYQASPPMGFSRQEYWSGLPLPSPKFSYMEPIKPFHTFPLTDAYIQRQEQLKTAKGRVGWGFG